MATVVTDDGVDVNGLRGHLAAHLPGYALPVFLRVCKSISVNGTFKYSKAELIQQGYDPRATTDLIYFNHPDWKKFIRVDQNLFQQLQDGRIRV
jgi:fatty-acyl-CoA synthase